MAEQDGRDRSEPQGAANEDSTQTPTTAENSTQGYHHCERQEQEPESVYERDTGHGQRVLRSSITYDGVPATGTQLGSSARSASL